MDLTIKQRSWRITKRLSWSFHPRIFLKSWSQQFLNCLYVSSSAHYENCSKSTAKLYEGILKRKARMCTWTDLKNLKLSSPSSLTEIKVGKMFKLMDLNSFLFRVSPIRNNKHYRCSKYTT